MTMFKIYRNIIPNDMHLSFYNTTRSGYKCRAPHYDSKQMHLQTLRYNSFAAKGPALFNLLPIHVKEADTLNIFKVRLDKFLQEFPDTPPTRGYVTINHNSLLDWAAMKSSWRWDSALLLRDDRRGAQSQISSDGGGSTDSSAKLL